MLQAFPRWRRRAAAAAAAVGAALALALLLLLPRHANLDASSAGSGDGDVFVPDVPGAAEAKDWLLRYASERRQRGDIPRWPEAVSLPACAPPGASAEGPAPAADPPLQQQAELQQELPPLQLPVPPLRTHLVLATVGDSWGPGPSQNRWEPATAAAELHTVPCPLLLEGQLQRVPL